MATAFDGGTADLARALTESPRGSSVIDGDLLSATPPRSRHSSSSSEAALLRVRAKIRREAEFVSVRGTCTHLIKYGSFDDSTHTLVLLIPGNPGVPEYYDHFMENLHLASGRSLPVWCVSHAGHVIPEDAHLPPFQQSDPHRTLRGQVDHKLSFIQDHVILPHRKLVSPALSEDPSNAVTEINLILVGHSIGCWMIIELMKRMKPKIKKQILKAFLLFPTIERMAVSPNGRFLTPLVSYIPCWLLAFPLHLFRLLPLEWRKSFVRFYFRGRGHIPDCIYRATLSLSQPRSVANSLELYYEEANTVIDPDLDFIQSNISILKLFYGTTDSWVPISYYREMKDVFPDGDIQLCEEGYEHAFVIKNSEEMALVVWGWVLELFEARRKS